jgi:hypothetical protein
VNGDFETGNLSPWTTFTTGNGTLGFATVVSFDVDGNGVASRAAQFNAGELRFEQAPGCDNGCRNTRPELFEGGGIRQAFWSDQAVLVRVSADVAVRTGPVGNFSGGRFELLVNGSVVAMEMVEGIPPNTTERRHLSADVTLAAGNNDLAVRVTRPFTVPPNPPLQYIDDIVIEPLSKGALLSGKGVPGKGLASAPGLQEPFNPKSSAADNAGPKTPPGGDATSSAADGSLP